MKNTISGYAEFEGENFVFFLSDYILTLVPSNGSIPEKVVYKQMRLPRLEGVTSDGHNICFFDFTFYKSIWSNTSKKQSNKFNLPY